MSLESKNLRKGFSLVELSIVLVIIGLLLGFGIRSCMQGIENAKLDNTKDKLSSIKSLIIKEFCKTGKLLKKEDLPTHYLRDAWNNEIKIFYANDLEKQNLCSLNATSLSVVLPSGKEIKNILLVILSPSRNGIVDSTISNNEIKLEEDDLWEYITLYEIKTKCCNGKELRIVTEYLPPIVEGENYEVEIVVTGGKPPYSCVPVSTDDNNTKKLLSEILENGTNDDIYCKIKIDSDFWSKKNILPLLSNSNQIKLPIRVSDSSNPPFIKYKEFYITIIKRNLGNRK